MLKIHYVEKMVLVKFMAHKKELMKRQSLFWIKGLGTWLDCSATVLKIHPVLELPVQDTRPATAPRIIVHMCC